jgi:carbon monoxide dehydrogenase subunit G
MASIHKEFIVNTQPEAVWAALRDFGAVLRLAPGFLTDCHLESEQGMTVRVVTFWDGRVAREFLVDIDDARKRLVYAEPGGRFITRSAALQVFAKGETMSRVTWTIDLLPDEFGTLISSNMDKAVTAMKQTLEAGFLRQGADR